MDRYQPPIDDIRRPFSRSNLRGLALAGILLVTIFAWTAHTAQAQERTTATVLGFHLAIVQPYTVNDPNAFVYTVRLGEYWILIARKFGVTYNELRAANPELWTLRGELIWPGDEMAIPGLTATDQWATVEYTVEPGDSWHRIADTFGVSYWDLRLDNLGLWRRRGIVIHPGDQMQIINPTLPARTASVASENTATAQPTATPTATATPAAAVTATPTPQASAPPALPPTTGSGPPFHVTNPPPDAVIYSVRPGDNWYSIGNRYGIAFERLRSANPELWALRGQDIRPADEMIIPEHGSPPPPIEIKTAPVGKAEPIPSNSNYTVLEGDTWATVAARSGVAEDDLKAANLVAAKQELAPGDVIRIP